MFEREPSGPQAVILRPMRPGDAETVVGMVKALAEFIGASKKAVMKPEELVRYAFGDHPFVEGIIAEENGTPVGLCLHYPVFSSWQGRPGVFILDLFVDERFRGSGLGQQMLSETARISRERGSCFMMLHVDHMNVSAQDFYTHLGFKHIASEQPYMVRGDAFQVLAGPRV